MGNIYTGSDVGKSGLRVRESDSSPDVSGVTEIVLTAADFSITDDGNGTITLATGAADGNTLDEAYDEGGAGVGRAIDADTGAVTITVSNTDNNGVLEITQNDTTNNPATLTITNTGTGDTITTSNALGEVFTVSSTEIVGNEIGADMDFRVEGDSNINLFITDAGLFSGMGAIGMGGAAVNTASVSVLPPAFTAVASTNISGLRVAPVGITVPTGTTTIASSLHLVEPVLTATGTITNAATIYIESAPTEGSNNYALWVDAGKAQFDGEVEIDGALNHDGTTIGFFGTTPATQASNQANIVGGPITGVDTVDATQLSNNLIEISGAVNAILAAIQRHGLMAP